MCVRKTETTTTGETMTEQPETQQETPEFASCSEAYGYGKCPECAVEQSC